MTGFDWPALMRAGMGRSNGGLGLSPDTFWRLTPAELAVMLDAGRHAAPLMRDGLERLMAAWPDQNKGG